MSLKRFLKRKKGRIKKKTDFFYQSKEWKELRYSKLRETRYCECCGKTVQDRLEGGERIKLTVDHIKPRSKYPELALEPNNLQVLCQACNTGKDDLYHDDFRGEFDFQFLTLGVTGF